MDKSKKDFLNSLDLIDQEMENYIPYALQDLLELGSMPEYVIKLIQKNVEPLTIKKIIDFGCGKGAVLIELSEHLDFNGLGVDIVHEFIDSANKYAIEKSVSDRIKFETGDLKAYLSKSNDYDIAIYGYDSNILGNIKETLLQLGQCINDTGYIILEIAYTPDFKDKIEGIPGEKELYQQMKDSKVTIVDKILWDINEIKRVNIRNNKLISKRISELKALYPDKIKIFERYMDNQLEECELIENSMICSTWILKKLL